MRRKHDEPGGYGKSLITALITIDGLLLTLSWGLLNLSAPASASIIDLVKKGSLCLLVSLIFSVLCMQFIVTASRQRFKGKYAGSVMEKNMVAISFLFGWLTFLVGGIFYALAIWTF